MHRTASAVVAVCLRRRRIEVELVVVAQDRGRGEAEHLADHRHVVQDIRGLQLPIKYASGVSASWWLGTMTQLRTCPVAGMVTFSYTGSRSRYSSSAI